ncbi:UNVERIFIED_CONTAM: putative indole-3-pyruvate monooxygenase YUCCA10 [Sesamum calycinum]|uniref:indole-3-pyruvate monooxygenase n=1 Tax=Sesamum calycinum TaxID=2727403 RepID=A0AAW2P6K7_9LAMI
MEIALDLCNWGARTSLVVRSPVHILNEWMVKLGMELLKYLPLDLVDNIVLTLSKIKYGNNLSDYGIQRPGKGPFFLKRATGRSPVIDVGTVSKIRAGEIEVFPSIKKVNGDHVQFAEGATKSYDAVVFATGYKSTVRKWLKDDGGCSMKMECRNREVQITGKEKTGFTVLDLQAADCLGYRTMPKLYRET